MPSSTQERMLRRCPSGLEEMLNADGGGYWVDKGRSGRLGEGHFYTADEGLVCCLVLWHIKVLQLRLYHSFFTTQRMDHCLTMPCCLLLLNTMKPPSLPSTDKLNMDQRRRSRNSFRSLTFQFNPRQSPSLSITIEDEEEQWTEERVA